MKAFIDNVVALALPIGLGIGVVAVIMLLLFGWCVRNRERIVEKIEEYED